MKTVQEKEGNELFFFLGSTHHRPIVSGAENIPFPSLSLSFICKIQTPAVQGWGLVCIEGDSLENPWGLIILGSLGRQEARSQ